MLQNKGQGLGLGQGSNHALFMHRPAFFKNSLGLNQGQPLMLKITLMSNYYVTSGTC
jgi:hypothetical protein